ncbi:MAG: N-acetyltransferase [Cyanobacteria bacterium J06635_15]
MTPIIRLAEPTDEPFLWEMLYQALYVPPGTPPLPRDIVFQPELAKYVEHWGQQGDIGCIAVSVPQHIAIGAAWLRLFTRDNPGYGYIDDNTPELSIAVLPDYRRQGIGTRLLTDLFERADSMYDAVSLSVSQDNPALRLYQHFGFEISEQQGDSFTMRRLL